MSRYRPFLVILVPFLVLPRLGAHAAASRTTLSGSASSIATPCATQVDIHLDPALHDRVTIQASAEHPEELGRLLLDTSGIVRIHTRSPGCWRPDPEGSFTPTLTLSIGVPAGFALSIDEAGAARYAIDAVGGALTLDLSGSVQLDDRHVTTMHADLSGDDTVRLGRVDGDANVNLSGHGTLKIDEAAIPALHVELGGNGSVEIAQGHIGHATLSTSGAGDMHFGATVGDADVALAGVGSVRFATVTGTLHKSIDGIGTVTVGP